MAFDSLHETVEGRYGKITFLSNDIGAVGLSVRKYGEWAENELTFLKTLAQPGSTIVDVGAYVGTHTLSFARFAGPQGHVISMEPRQGFFTLLQKNVHDNSLTNVQLEHSAAAAHSSIFRTSPLDLSERRSFGSTSIELPTAAFPAAINLESITTISIDSLKLGSCALIKVDAEDSEDAVISGAAETIARFSPAIYAECNSVASGLRTFDLLHKFGYATRMHVVDAFNPANFFGDDENIFGKARESALVGLQGMQLAFVDAMQPRPCELILKIETADDLALGMLNKPQYFGEVLEESAAYRSGGRLWLDEIGRLRESTQKALAERDEAREIARVERDSATEQARISSAKAVEAESAREQARISSAKAAQAEADMERLHNTLQAMEYSRSWRLTKPLRILGQFLRRER